MQSRWWFRYGNGYTNDNGYFECDKTYNHNRNVTVKVHFENPFVKIRGIKGLNFMHMFFVEDNTLGTFSNNALENISYLHTNTVNDLPTNLASNTKRKWIACHAINSVREYSGYAQSNGLMVQSTGFGAPLNFWVTGYAKAAGYSLSTDASAPILRQMSNSSLLIGVINLVISQQHPLFPAVVQVMQQFLPDITYNYSTSWQFYLYSDRIMRIFYHELAHSSHYYKVGNSYWSSYIAYIVQHMGYGTASTSGAGRIAISEAWAEYCGTTFAHFRFGNTTSLDGGITYQEEIENFKPFAGTIDWEWIPEGLMHDLVAPMIEPDNNGVIDRVEGYTMQKCYNALTPSVTSVSQYRTTFLNQNPGMNMTQLGFYNQLFSSYGY